MAVLNQELLQYKGYTAKEKVISDCHKILQENKLKELGYLPRPNESCLITVLDKNKEEILGIGGSKPSDLILDNWGTWWALMGGVNNGFFFPKQTNGSTANNFKSKGTTQNWYNFTLSATAGTRIQVGSGATPPTRADFFVDTAFGTSPESVSFNTPIGGYNSGLGQISYGASIGATGGSGTVAEAITILVFVDLGNISRAMAITRDLISPTVGFSPANFINVNYIWQI